MLYQDKNMVNMMETSLAETMGVRGSVVGQEVHNKSQLDSIVGSLWQQARQESSGSSIGNQSPRNGEDMSEGDGDPGSPADSSHDIQHQKEREEDNEVANDLRTHRDTLPFSFPGFPGGLAGLPPALEALNKHQKEFLSSSIVLPVSSPQGLLKASSPQGGLGKAPSHLFPPHSLSFPPMTPPSQDLKMFPPGSQSSSPSEFGTQQNWSFEEQFKQLYEIDDNPKRKEFLDELFAFMQKRGTPINRLPIMAKQVLDLYELYNLVVARGGLVEVINKKLWQEIIKGLGLPSSITSAAFTLRTQYTKYLYPMECKLNNFSNSNDLQSAIEGNKREGRTTSYGPYGGMGLPFQTSPLPPSIGSLPQFSLMGAPHRPPHLNGGPPRPQIHPERDLGRFPDFLSYSDFPVSRSPPGLPTGPQDPLSAFEMTRLALLKMYNQSGMGADPLRPPGPLSGLPIPPPDLARLHHEKALNLQVKRDMMQQREEERERREHEREMELKRERAREITVDTMDEDDQDEAGASPPPSKRLSGSGHSTNNNNNNNVIGEHSNGRDSPMMARQTPSASSIVGATNIKITSRGEGAESSLVVCMELNGMTYQGILFQKPSS